MRRIWKLASVAVLCACGLIGSLRSTDCGPAATTDLLPDETFVYQQLGAMPLTFTKNAGQWDDRVQFRANVGGAVMWFTDHGAYYQFTHRIARETTPKEESDPMDSFLGHLPHRPTGHESDSVETLFIKATFVGANPAPEVTGEQEMAYKCNYFLGNDPAEWRTDVPNYRAVVFRDVYEGIDLKYYGTGDGQMEYDFAVSPGGDPSQIQVRYDGAKSVSVNTAGELVVETEWGTVTECTPVIYQQENGERTSIHGEYVLLSESTFGFRMTERYNPTLALVIDPVLSYSTYLGGSDDDFGYGIAVDGSGSVYVAGLTMSTDFPTENPLQAAYGGGFRDAFVTKLNASGAALVYSTYLGGSYHDEGWGIAVDGLGSAYVTGFTNSTDFPTANPLQAAHGGGIRDAFVTKLSASGSTLVYSTYLGGSDLDVGGRIAVDGSGSAYVTGVTRSTNFPTENPFQGGFAGGIEDGFVTKLSASGTTLVYSTYLGGSVTDVGEGIAVDGSGSAYVTGSTSSTDFPTANPLQAAHGGGIRDAFVTKLSASGTTLVYSTYVGGSDDDRGLGITVDGSGSAYMTGVTYSTDFPTANPFQVAHGGGDVDAFVTKLNAAGTALVYSTYLGGTGNDEGWVIAVDGLGSAHVTGHTGSIDFPTANPSQAANAGGLYDVFVTKLSASGTTLVYSTYFGGSDDDQSWGIAVEGNGSVYVTGNTGSTDFRTANPVQATNAGNYDGFVAKLEDWPLGLSAVPSVGNPPLTVFFSGLTDTTVDSWTWSLGDGDSAFVQNPVHTYTDTGSYDVTLLATIGTDTFFIPRADYIRVNSLKADFVGTPRWGIRPFDVDFTDLSTGGPTGWYWDFGDARSSALQNPTHTYTDTGWFNVTLVVDNAVNRDSVRFLKYVHSDTSAIPDLLVMLYGSTRPRPGFDKTYYIGITNEGTGVAAAGGLLKFSIPLPSTYVSSSPLGDVAGELVSWVLPATMPNDELWYSVTINVPVGTPADTPLTSTATADSADGEVELTNNFDDDVETVVTSFDPNDKVVQPEGCGPGKDIIHGDEDLSYTIFFENKKEATAEAIYVLIVDTLSPDFDWGTLSVGPTSHDDVMDFTFDAFTGEMRWFFDSIMLMPNVTPPEGEGFVSYSISPKPGLPDATVLSNRAQIRFDFETWLEAPEAGPLDLTISTCPCDCPFQADINGDGFIDSIDLSLVIDIVFFGLPDIQDPVCPTTRGDFNNDGFADSVDLSLVIDHVFFGGTGPDDPCTP